MVAAAEWGFDSSALDLNEFVPSFSLDQAPQPLTNITLSLPNGTISTERQVVQLMLLIDEAGWVLDMLNDSDASVPELYVQAAKAAFAPARFTPSSVGGQPVRTRMRVEVSFEEAPERTGGAGASPRPLP